MAKVVNRSQEMKESSKKEPSFSLKEALGAFLLAGSLACLLLLSVVTAVLAFVSESLLLLAMRISQKAPFSFELRLRIPGEKGVKDAKAD